MRMMNPSMMVSRLDLVFLELAAAGTAFRRLRLVLIFYEVKNKKKTTTGTGHYVKVSPKK